MVDRQFLIREFHSLCDAAKDDRVAASNALIALKLWEIAASNLAIADAINRHADQTEKVAKALDRIANLSK